LRRAYENSQVRARFFRKGPDAAKSRQFYAYLRERRDQWPVKEMCEVLAVSESGYYRSLKPTLK